MSTLKLIIEFKFSSILSADEESNKILNFLYSNISDEIFFSNYNQKKCHLDFYEMSKKVVN